MPRIRGVIVVCVAVCVLGVTTPARASAIREIPFDPVTGGFADAFTADTEVLLIRFLLTDAAQIDVQTASWATGGIDPLLSLFSFSQPSDDPTGSLIADNDDIDPFGNLDAHLLSSPDTDISPFDVLPAGAYGVTVTKGANYSFDRILGHGFFADGDVATPCQPGDPGCGFFGTLAIIPLEQPAPVPEPGTLALLAAGLGGVAARRMRRRATNT